MDADFMNAKEMKYNVERKKITFTWMREEEKKLHTFYFASSTIFFFSLLNTCTFTVDFYLFYTIILSCCC